MVTRGYKPLYGFTGSYKGLQEIRGGLELITVGYKRLQQQQQQRTLFADHTNTFSSAKAMFRN